MKKQLPQLILIDGATGAGKSSLLTYLRCKYSTSVFVGAKLTTRQRRTSDRDWEFRFVKCIPQQYAQYSFNSVGNLYAIDQDELIHAISQGLVYAISCVDQRVIEKLRLNFDIVTIYLYRAWTATDFEELLVLRGSLDQMDSQLRRNDVATIASQYLEKIEFYDHVILNVGSKADMLEQLSKILLLRGITPNAVPRKDV